MTAIDWLLDSDPAIRWQVMRDLTDEPDDVVNAERAKVATEGWGKRVLELQGANGTWEGAGLFPEFTSTNWSLMQLRDFGINPAAPAARRAIALVREHGRWEHAGQRFFDGEVEPCINGKVVALGAYFGEDVTPVVDRLLGEQMEDGGWNCEQENGSVRGSFDSTIAVLEGLREFERAAGATPNVTDARVRGQEYLLERRMFRRRSTGDVVDERYTQFSFPPYYFYDVLWGLDYLRASGVDSSDGRLDEAIRMLEQRRNEDGRWPLENVHQGKVHFEMDDGEGKPSRWNTLRALRVLRWSAA